VKSRLGSGGKNFTSRTIARNVQTFRYCTGSEHLTMCTPCFCESSRPSPRRAVLAVQNSVLASIEIRPIFARISTCYLDDTSVSALSCSLTSASIAFRLCCRPAGSIWLASHRSRTSCRQRSCMSACKVSPDFAEIDIGILLALDRCAFEYRG